MENSMEHIPLTNKNLEDGAMTNTNSFEADTINSCTENSVEVALASLMENSQNNCFETSMEVTADADDLSKMDDIYETNLPPSEESNLKNSMETIPMIKEILSNGNENSETYFLMPYPINSCKENPEEGTLSTLKENSLNNDQLPNTISSTSIEPQMECVSSSDFQNSEKEETNILNVYRQKEIIDLSNDESMYSGLSSSSDSEEDSSSVISSSSESEIELNFSSDSDDSPDLSENIAEPSIGVAAPVSQKCIATSLLETVNGGGMCSYCISLNNNNSSNSIMVNKTITDKKKDVCDKFTAHAEDDINLCNNSSSNSCKSTIVKIDKNVKSSSDEISNTENNNGSISEECTNSTTEKVDICDVAKFCTCERNKIDINRNANGSQEGKSKKSKKSTFDDIDLPPIEDLHISVEESEAKPIGTILHTVGNLVVVRTYPGIPAIDLDSVLFLDHGKRALGCVEDVFGQIYEPHYVVRFNSTEHIREKKIEKDQIVYYAPQTEHTSFVILDDLISMKGSDASWKDNREPPVHLLDYSDDEEERNARAALKAKKKQANGDVQMINEVNRPGRKVRNEDFNPFSPSSAMRPPFPRPRFTAPRYCGNDRPIYRAKRHLAGPQRSGFRFGGPPNLREGVHSPFVPHFSQVPDINQSCREAWYPRSDRSDFSTRQSHHNTRSNIRSPLSSTPPPSPNIFNYPPPRSPYQYTGPPQSQIPRQIFGATPPPVLGQNCGSSQVPGQNCEFSPLTCRSSFATPPPVPGQNFEPPPHSPAPCVGAPQHMPPLQSPSQFVLPPHMPPPQSPGLFVEPSQYVLSSSQSPSPSLQVALSQHMPLPLHSPAHSVLPPQHINQPPRSPGQYINVPQQALGQNYNPPSQKSGNRGPLPRTHDQNFVHPPQLRGQNFVPLPQAPSQNFVPPPQAPSQNFMPPSQAPSQNFVLPPQAPNQNFMPPPQAPSQNFAPPSQTPSQNFVPPSQAPNQNFVPPPQASSQNFVPSPQSPSQYFVPSPSTPCQNFRPPLQTSGQAFIPPLHDPRNTFRPPPPPQSPGQYAGPQNMLPLSLSSRLSTPPPPFNLSFQVPPNSFHSPASPNSPSFDQHGIQHNQGTYRGRW